MDIEKHIKNSWDKVPDEIKQKIKNLDFTVEKENKKIPEARATLWKYGELHKITFYTNKIEEDIERAIYELLMHELSHYFGFSEDKSQEIAKKFRNNLGTPL